MSYTSPSSYGNFYDPPPTASTKDPDDICAYIFVWSQEFINEPGDSIITINSAAFSPGNGVLPDLALNGEPTIVPDPTTNVAAQAVSVPTQGGVANVIYTISVSIGTAQGNTFRRSLFVPCNNL